MAECIATFAADKAMSCVLGKVKKHFLYFWNSTENVEKMKKEVKDLKIMRQEVGQQIRSAKSEADDLKAGAQGWVEEVDDAISKAEEFLIYVTLDVYQNNVSRYRYGKRASLMSPCLVKHKDNGKHYVSRASVNTPVPDTLDVYENKNLDDIATHSSCLEDIIKAIEDETKQIIGIYGLGGVGKTTLAKEVKARVNDHAVAFTTVSHNIDYERMKKETEVARKRIMKGEKVLIILDDVWRKLDLGRLDIPSLTKYKNCKILLTSRNKEVCDDMEAHKIWVNALPSEEAWILFKRIVGDVVENNAELHNVAKEVAEKCGGLPLLLNAVGNALKTRSIQDWKEASKQLREPAPSLRSRYPQIGDAFACLQLSYDFLENEEAQLCFLLCCMFPEDEEILLETLVYYVVGLAKFCRLESIDDARWRVEKAVEILTYSGLLLNLEDKRYTKMHDVARDVALIIATEDQNNFLVEAGKGLTEWLPTKGELESSYTGISLMKNEITELPDYEIRLPRLEIFLISDNAQLAMFPDELVQGMKEVKVLDMGNCNQRVLRGFQLLTKLRVLNLRDNNNVADISMLGEMKELEILILNNTDIREIPIEIGQLVNLRRLEALDCRNLNGVAKCVISKLRRLEELRIGLTCLGETIDDRIVEVKTCIDDIMKLSKLTYLDLVVPGGVIPEGLNFGKLKRFGIQIGGSRCLVFSHSDCRLVIVAVDVGTPLLDWTKKLTAKKTTTILDSIKNINNIIPDLSHAGFNEIEHIELKSCENVSYLVDKADGEGKINEKFFGKLKHLELRGLGSLEALWNCSDEYISLSNLVTLKIWNCHKLVRLFSVSVAQGLVNLQNLNITWCDSLEEVIWDGDEETNKGEIEQSECIVFRSLAKITFLNLGKLERFYSGYSTIKYPSLVDVIIVCCDSMMIWGPGIHEAPKLKVVGKLPLDGPDATLNDIVAKAREGEGQIEAIEDAIISHLQACLRC